MSSANFGFAMAVVILCATGTLAQAARVSYGREELIDQVLARSGELAGMRQRVELAFRAGRSAQYPTNPVLSVELEGSPSPWSSREYTRRIAVDQEIDLRGERAARRDAFAAGSGVLREDLRAREQAIVAQIDEAASRWLVAHRRLDVLEPALVQARSLGQRARTARRRELLTPFAERMLRADATEIQSDEIQARVDLERSVAQLKAWLGTEADSLNLEGPLSPEVWSCEEGSVVLLALEHRADLARARAAETQAVARLELARRLGRVNPTLGVSVGQERLEIETGSQTFSSRDILVGVRGSVPLPLFQSNRLERAEGQLEVERARTETLAQELQVRSEVALACAAIHRAQERVGLLTPLSESATSDLRTLEAAYRDGRSALDEYLTLRERLLRAQRGYVEALGDLEEARNAIVRATGLRRPELAGRLGK